MRGRTRRITLTALVLGLGLTLAGPAIEAGAARTRPSKDSAKAGGAARGARTAAPSGRSAGGAVASGRASYGYARRGHGAIYPRYRLEAWGWGWGYPYGGYYWGWPVVYTGWYPGTADRALRPAPEGVVETDVKPKKAEVRVDGEFVGQARDYNGNWDILVLDAGAHFVEFSAPGYRTLGLRVDVHEGAHHRIVQRLQKGEGIDPRSDDPPPPPETRAAPRPVDPDPVTSFRADLDDAALRTGMLRIRVRPADAVVYLDGEFLARADELARLHGALPVAEGDHRIEVVRPGFETQRRRVSIQGEEPVTVEIELRRRD